jgi:hypothetical protein
MIDSFCACGASPRTFLESAAVCPECHLPWKRDQPGFEAMMQLCGIADTIIFDPTHVNTLLTDRLVLAELAVPDGDHADHARALLARVLTASPCLSGLAPAILPIVAAGIPADEITGKITQVAWSHFAPDPCLGLGAVEETRARRLVSIAAALSLVALSMPVDDAFWATLVATQHIDECYARVDPETVPDLNALARCLRRGGGRVPTAAEMEQDDCDITTPGVLAYALYHDRAGNAEEADLFWNLLAGNHHDHRSREALFPDAFTWGVPLYTTPG